MLNKKIILIVIASLMPLVANSAQIVDRATLQTLIGGPGTLENFESYIINPGVGTLMNSTSLDSTIMINGQGPGLVGAGVTYSSVDAFGLAWQGASFFGSPSKEIVSNDYTMDIDFSVFTNAFGIDLRTYNVGGGDIASMAIYGLDDTTLIGTLNNIVLSGTPVFGGWTDNGGIGRIELTSTVNSYSAFIDNLEYGTAVIPLPAAAWLFGTALFGLGMVKRKKV